MQARSISSDHARGQLGPLNRDEHIVEHDRVLELERGQARQHLLEPRAVRLERRERLIRLGQHVGDRLELVARLADEDRDRLTLLRDRDHERVRLLGDSLGRAVPGAGLGRGDRRVRHQLHVRVGELRNRRVDDDRPVHLGQLVEQLRRERQVEPHAAREQERELLRVADHDQRALARADDVVDRLPQLGSRRDAPDRGEQPPVEPWILLRRLADRAEALGSPACLILLRLALHRSLSSPPA